MQSTQLVLGLGNECKKVLQSLENEFPSWRFAILDCWSKVQEVKAVEEEHFEEEDLRIRFIHNLNHFISHPQIAVRFDGDKYEDAETQKITSYLPHYIDLLQKEKQIRFHNIVKELTHYKEVLIICPTVDGISLVWLHPLVKALQLQSTIRIFSWHPFLLEGRLKTEMAAAVCEQLMDTTAKHFCLFRQETLKQNKHKPMKDVLKELTNIQQQAVRSLLLNETPSHLAINLL